MTGSGLGTFVFAPMVRYFMDNYGTRGGLILVSGVMLNLCVVGSLMREPVWWIKHRQKKLEVKIYLEVLDCYLEYYYICTEIA